MEIDPKAKKCPHCQTDQRNWFARHQIITGLMVVVIGLIAIGSAAPKTQTPKSSIANKVESSIAPSGQVETPTPAAQTRFRIGETIQMEEYQLTVNSVKKAFSYGYSKPKKGSEYVFVNVTLRNQGEKEVSYNPYDFKIQNSDGNQTSTTYASTEDELHSGDLAQGGKVTGTLSFEAPVGDKNLQLIYQPNFWLDERRITVELQ